MKRSSDSVSIDRRKAELYGYGLLAMTGYLRRIGLLGLALMTASWILHAGSAETPKNNGNWINTWTAGPMPPWAGPIPAGFFDQTVRQVVRISLGGERMRVRLSNEFGFRPVEVAAALLPSREPQGRFRQIRIEPLPLTESPRLHFYRVLRC